MRRRRNPRRPFADQVRYVLQLEEFNDAMSPQLRVTMSPSEMSDADLDKMLRDALEWVEWEEDREILPTSLSHSDFEKVKKYMDRGDAILNEIGSRPHLAIVEEVIEDPRGGVHTVTRLAGIRPRNLGLRRRNPVAMAVQRRQSPTITIVHRGTVHNADDVVPLTSEVIEIYNRSKAYGYSDDFLEEIDAAMKFWYSNQSKKHYWDEDLFDSLRDNIPRNKRDWDKETLSGVRTVINHARMTLAEALNPVDQHDESERDRLLEGIDDMKRNPRRRRRLNGRY